MAIEDKSVIENVFPQLGEQYTKVISASIVDMIQTFSPEEIKLTVSNANDNQRKAIMDAFIKGYIKCEDIQFRDVQKIKAISDAIDADFMEIITNVEIDEKLKDSYLK